MREKESKLNKCYHLFDFIFSISCLFQPSFKLLLAILSIENRLTDQLHYAYSNDDDDDVDDNEKIALITVSFAFYFTSTLNVSLLYIFFGAYQTIAYIKYKFYFTQSLVCPLTGFQF